MSAAPNARGAADVAIGFRNLAFGYDRRPVLEAVDGEVRRGEFLAVVGRNGAGKSTLLKGIVGDAVRLGGSFAIGGAGMRDVAYLPQRLEIDRGFPITVSEFAAMGLWRRLGAWGRSRRLEMDAVAAALGKVGLTGLETVLIGSLSGGQMQRLLFARTLVQDAAIILLDEPFTSIDQGTTEELLRVVTGWRGEGRTVVAALHDLAQVAGHFPRSLLLDGRPVAWGATPDVLAVIGRERHGRMDALCAHEHPAQAEPARSGLTRDGLDVGARPG